MGQAAYLASVKGSGVSTAFTNNSLRRVAGSVATYALPAVGNRVFNHNVEPVVKANNIVQPSDSYDVNYLMGTVTFKSSQGVKIITATGEYIPLVTIAGCHEYSIELSSDILDNTDLSTTGYRSKQTSLEDISVTLSRYYDLSQKFKDALKDRTNILIEIKPGGSEVIRGWFVVESANNSGDVGSLETEALTFKLITNIKPNSTFYWS